jgi:hypothetical protein
MAVCVIGILTLATASPAGACIKEGYNKGWNNRAKTLNDPVTKGMIVTAKDVGQPDQGAGLLNSNGNITDKFKEYFPQASGMMGGLFQMVQQMFSSMTGQGGAHGSNPGPNASTSGGGSCDEPKGAKPKDFRSRPQR